MLVIPGDLIWIGWIGRRLVGLVHPLRNGAEVQDDRMPLGGFQEIDRHRIDQGKIPRGFALLGRLKFRHAKFWIRKPGNITNVVGAKIMDGLVCIVVNRSSTAQRWIDDDLQRRSGLRNADNLVPMDFELLFLMIRRPPRSTHFPYTTLYTHV